MKSKPAMHLNMGPELRRRSHRRIEERSTRRGRELLLLRNKVLNFGNASFGCCTVLAIAKSSYCVMCGCNIAEFAKMKNGNCGNCAELPQVR